MDLKTRIAEALAKAAGDLAAADVREMTAEEVVAYGFAEAAEAQKMADPARAKARLALLAEPLAKAVAQLKEMSAGPVEKMLNWESAAKIAVPVYRDPGQVAPTSTEPPTGPLPASSQIASNLAQLMASVGRVYDLNMVPMIAQAFAKAEVAAPAQTPAELPALPVEAVTKAVPVKWPEDLGDKTFLAGGAPRSCGDDFAAPPAAK